MPHEKKKTDWETKPGVETVDGYEAWSHTGPHEINDGVVDGEVSFDYGDDDEDEDED